MYIAEAQRAKHMLQHSMQAKGRSAEEPCSPCEYSPADSAQPAQLSQPDHMSPHVSQPHHHAYPEHDLQQCALRNHKQQDTDAQVADPDSIGTAHAAPYAQVARAKEQQQQLIDQQQQAAADTAADVALQSEQGLVSRPMSHVRQALSHVFESCQEHSCRAAAADAEGHGDAAFAETTGGYLETRGNPSPGAVKFAFAR